VTSAAGPLANLFLGLVSFFILWQVKRPGLLPFLLWGPVAMIQEGVTFSLGMLTPGGDADLINAVGIPKTEILLAGVLLLIGGAAVITVLLPLVGFQPNDSLGKILFILIFGTCSLMSIRLIHSLLVAPQYNMENAIPMLFSCALAVLIAFLFRPLTARLDITSVAKSCPATWHAPLFGLSLGVSMFLVQIAAFN
jgi:hypothetical protein